MMKQFLIALFLLLNILCIKAQDVHPNQFASTSLALNPAFTGTSDAWRASFLYRVQYPSSPNTLNSSYFGLDYNLPSQRNSIGMFIQSDRIGVGSGGGFRSLQVNALYSYLLPAGEYWRIKMGLSVGYGSKNLNYFNLIYGDQLSQTGVTNGATQDNALASQSIDYLDVASGFLAYNEYAWIGFSAHHLSQPTLDFLGTQYKVPMRLSGHLGIKIPINESERQFVSPALIFRSQGGIHLLDAGAFFETEVFQAGIWYRNLPIQTQGSSSINIQTGIKHEGFRLNYSYGMVIGGLNGLGGGHEISLSFAPQRDVDERKWEYQKSPVF
jgi:type IX secretion system PorP/SprF family membrane protein